MICINKLYSIRCKDSSPFRVVEIIRRYTDPPAMEISRRTYRRDFPCWSVTSPIPRNQYRIIFIPMKITMLYMEVSTEVFLRLGSCHHPSSITTSSFNCVIAVPRNITAQIPWYNVKTYHVNVPGVHTEVPHHYVSFHPTWSVIVIAQNIADK